MPEVVGTSKSIYGFDPRSVPGCILWLDGADSSTLFSNSTTLASFGGTVGIWKDKSGNQANVSNASPAAIWSNNGVLFNGTSSSVLSNSTSFLSSINTNIFIVFNCTSSPGTRQGTFYYAYPSSNYFYIDTQYAQVQNSTNYYLVGPTSMTTSQFYIYSMTAPTSSTYTYSSNGIASILTASGAAGGAGTALYVGSNGFSTPLTGYISEIIMYNGNITTSQRQAVEGYLAWKWVETLPTTHPFYSIPTFSRYFSPIDIPGCALWLDAAQDTTAVASYVTSIPDKSGNGNTMTPSSTTGIARGSGTYGILNGIPVYNFSSYYASNASFTWSTNFTQIVVVNCAAAKWSTCLYNAGNLAYVFAYNYGLMVISSLGVDDSVKSVGSNILAYGGGTGLNQWYIFSIGYTSGSTTATNYSVNGIPLATTTGTAYTGQLATNPFYLNWVSGGVSDSSYVAEFIHYNTSLTTPQRQQVEGYLSSKWGIPLPSNHPYYKIPPSTSQPVQYGDVAYGNWTRDYLPFINAMITSNAGSTPTFATYALGSYNGYANGVGGSLHPNGNIYFAPSVTTGILTFNTNTFAFSTFTPTGATLTSNGWQGAALHPNGKIYFCPFGAANILMIDPVAGVGSNIAFSGATYTTNGWRGAIVAPNGTIYFIPYLATNFLSYNPTTGLFSNITGGTYAATNYYFLGAVLAPNGNIYGIPYGSSNILCVNTSTNVVTTIAPGTGSYTMVAGNYNWRGGVLGPDGYIYGIPSASSNFLKINPITNTATNVVPTGASIAGSNGWTTGTLGPDGCIYCQPFSNGSSNVLKYNPITNVATFIPITGWVSGNTWYQCYLTSNAIFFGTSAASNVLKLTFSGIALSPSPALCYSTFYNNL